jgi:hypothetical protein
LLTLRCRKCSKVFLPETEIENVWHKHCEKLHLFILFFSLFGYHICIYECFHCMLDSSFIFCLNLTTQWISDMKEDTCLFNIDYLKVNWFCYVT